MTHMTNMDEIPNMVLYCIVLTWSALALRELSVKPLLDLLLGKFLAWGLPPDGTSNCGWAFFQPIST